MWLTLLPEIPELNDAMGPPLFGFNKNHRFVRHSYIIGHCCRRGFAHFSSHD